MKLATAYCLLVLLCTTSHVSAQTKLSGKTYSITLLRMSGKPVERSWKWDTDELSFSADGLLASKSMKEHEKFYPAVCTITADTAKALYGFKCSMKNNYVSTIKWDGIVNGNKISGTAEWKNEYGVEIYRFSGQLKK